MSKAKWFTIGGVVLKKSESFTTRGGFRLRDYSLCIPRVPKNGKDCRKVEIMPIVVSDGTASDGRHPYKTHLEYYMYCSKHPIEKTNTYAWFYRDTDRRYKLLVDGSGKGFMSVDAKDVFYLSPVVIDHPSLIEGTIRRGPAFLQWLPKLFGFARKIASPSKGYVIHVNTIHCEDADMKALADFITAAASRFDYVRPGICQ